MVIENQEEYTEEMMHILKKYKGKITRQSNIITTKIT